MDPIFLAEVIIVGLIIVAQIWVFIRNLQAIGRLGKLFPKAQLLQVEEATEVDLESVSTTAVPQLKDDGRFSSGFRDILYMTNDYLRRNKGSSQGERLQEIAERKSESQEEAIETNLPLPLYIGLLATFTGVIIGLIKIAMVGVSDAAIQSFIGGVVVGMIGSASGLLLTVRSNAAFKDRKEDRDKGMETYFNFLRTKVFHPESAPVQGSVKGLRDSLAAFQDGFAQYQGQMNESLGDTLRLFSELKDVFRQIRSIEQELKGINTFLHGNDELIEKQTKFLESYHQKAESFTKKLGTSFQSIDKQVGAMVDENIRVLDQSTKAAYLKMDQYLASLDGNDQKAFARALSNDLAQINDDIKNLQEKSLSVNAQLLERLAHEDQSRQVLSATVAQLNRQLASGGADQQGLMANPVVKTFLFTGIAAFLLGIGSGVFYFIQAFGG
ncbi:MAG: hypothetical protein AAF587_09015 [Bacteroidota bacterium]